MVSFYPRTIKEALEILKNYENVTIFAGGTDLMVTRQIKENVLFIQDIEELKTIERKGAWEIGAGCTFAQMIQSNLPDIVKEVSMQVASPAIRNSGTIGGNICNASPAGDTLPMLYAMHARLVLASINAKKEVVYRTLSIRDFIQGVRKIDRYPEELLVKIILEKPSDISKQQYYFRKVGARRAEAITKISFFGSVSMAEDRIVKLAVAFGAVGITVVYDDELAQQMEKLTRSDLKEQKAQILANYMRHVNPIDDQRSTARYRKLVAKNLLSDFLEQISGSGEE